MIIFNINLGRVYNTNTRKKYYLSRYEIDLLAILSNNTYNSYKEMSRYLYRYFRKRNIVDIACIRRRLERKLEYIIDIKVIRGRGYVLLTDILIE